MAKRSTRKQMDESWLNGANGLIVVARTRVGNEAAYGEKIRETIVDLFGELWPMEEKLDADIRLTEIAGDIDRMPLDLLDDLVDALAHQAKARGGPNTAENTALRALAGWLRTRAVELRGEDGVLAQAGRLKQHHADLFAEVLGVMLPTAESELQTPVVEEANRYEFT